jgi:4-amino-4-deoxy-L-arabinose transferase-like glycosyltransferase
MIRRQSAPLWLRDRAPAPAGAGDGAHAAPPVPVVHAPAGAADTAAWRRLTCRPELLGLLLLAAVLDFWSLDRNGFANDYYAAGVRSMAGSWHAFLYGAFDPSGLMTVDKPPLASWVQALSVRAFGFSSWSILAPQALMGVATVALVYDLTRRRWGRVAGGVAGLVLATTPIAVAMFRHDNPDALLLLTATGAVWAVVRGLEDGGTRWLLLAGVCVGLAFETKMGAGLLVVPGLALAWFWVAPRGRAAAVRQLLAGGTAMVVVGGAWPLLVALTPAADRPWISGTNDNSILSLILGYNGFGRLTGQSGGPAAGGGFGGGGGVFGGSPGVLRLLDASLGGQAGWLAGAAGVSLIGGAVVTRGRRTDPATGFLVAVGGAWVVAAVAFSSAEGIFHPYYVSLLAPFTAALVGAGTGLALRGDRAARVIGPAAVAAGIACELIVLARDGTGLGWVTPVLLVLAVPATLALAGPLGPRVRGAVLAVALAALLAAPATWAVQTLGHATEGTFPAGGPASASTVGFGGGGRPGLGRSGAGAGTGGRLGGATGSSQQAPAAPPAGGGANPFGGRQDATLTADIAYAQAHGGGTLAVASQSGAAAAIIAARADVAGIGGFSGRESAVSATWLADAVRDGRLRWVVTSDGGGVGGFAGRGGIGGGGGGFRAGGGAVGGGAAGAAGDGRTGATRAMAIVEQACTPVATDGASASATSSLYDCAGKADAIEAAATAVAGSTRTS